MIKNEKKIFFLEEKLVVILHSVLCINWEHSYMKSVLSCKCIVAIIAFSVNS